MLSVIQYIDYDRCERHFWGGEVDGVRTKMSICEITYIFKTGRSLAVNSLYKRLKLSGSQRISGQYQDDICNFASEWPVTADCKNEQDLTRKAVRGQLYAI